jgi:hypothetical protein
VKYVLIGLLKVWRLAISPLYGNVCRYYPSCSAYALRAVQYHGAIRGSWLAARRLLRCHPWTPGGYDPVPGTPEFDEEMHEQSRKAATMGSGPVVGTGPVGSAGAGPAGAAESGRRDHGCSGHQSGAEPRSGERQALLGGQQLEHRQQGRAVAVKQGQGSK